MAFQRVHQVGYDSIRYSVFGVAAGTAAYRSNKPWPRTNSGNDDYRGA